MKRLILITAFMAVSLAGMAQTKADTVYIKIHKNDLFALQNVFGFSFQWLPKSKAPASDVEDVKAVMQQLYPKLVADTVKKQPVIKKP